MSLVLGDKVGFTFWLMYLDIVGFPASLCVTTVAAAVRATAGLGSRNVHSLHNLWRQGGVLWV